MVRKAVSRSLKSSGLSQNPMWDGIPHISAPGALTDNQGPA